MGLNDDYLRNADTAYPCPVGEHKSLAECNVAACTIETHGHDVFNPACPGRDHYYGEPSMQSTGGMFLGTIAAKAEERFQPSDTEGAEETRAAGEISEAAANEIVRQPRESRFRLGYGYLPDYGGAWDAYIRQFQAGRGTADARAGYQARKAESARLSKHHEYAGLEPRHRLGACDGGSDPFGLWVVLTWSKEPLRTPTRPLLAAVPEDVLRSVYRVKSCRRVIVEDDIGATSAPAPIPLSPAPDAAA